MNCYDFQQLISVALDQELSEAEQQILAEHLRICGGCSEFVKKLNELKNITSEWKESEFPVELEHKILSRTVDSAPEEKPVFNILKGYYKIPRSLAWAAVLLFLMLLVNSIFNPWNILTESEKGQKISPPTTKIQKIILTDKDVVKTYTISGR